MEMHEEVVEQLKIHQGNFRVLLDYVKKNVDLVEFIETHAQTPVRRMHGETSAVCNCPMPDHDDRNASFHANLMEDSGKWVFRCFGCSSQGTIINFCMDFFGHKNAKEALLYLCTAFEIKNDADIVINALKNLKRDVDLSRKMECSHIVTAHQCHLLLRKSYEKHAKWVYEAYKRLNKALAEDDFATVELVGQEAGQRMHSRT